MIAPYEPMMEPEPWWRRLTQPMGSNSQLGQFLGSGMAPSAQAAPSLTGGQALQAATTGGLGMLGGLMGGGTGSGTNQATAIGGGALTGAATGASVGGPIGALVGAGLGGGSAALQGFFSKKKRKKEAENRYQDEISQQGYDRANLESRALQSILGTLPR